MKRSWIALVATVLVGALAGVALAGRTGRVDQTVIPGPATTAPTTTAPVTTAG